MVLKLLLFFKVSELSLFRFQYASELFGCHTLKFFQANVSDSPDEDSLQSVL